jgi:hypothetical protein
MHENCLRMCLHIVIEPYQYVDYRAYKNPPSLRQLNPVHILTAYYLTIILYIVLPSTSGSPKQPPAFRFSTKIWYAFLTTRMCGICPTHPILHWSQGCFERRSRIKCGFCTETLVNDKIFLLLRSLCYVKGRPDTNIRLQLWMERLCFGSLVIALLDSTRNCQTKQRMTYILSDLVEVFLYHSFRLHYFCLCQTDYAASWAEQY